MMFANITEIFSQAECVNIIDDGSGQSYCAGDGRFEEILGAWTETLSGCREMPAFGVSLDDMITEAMKSGLWAEFCFSGKLWYGEMSFEKLLVQVNAPYTGFNLHRYNAECGYNGRCYYVDLEEGKTLENFYSIIKLHKG